MPSSFPKVDVHHHIIPPQLVGMNEGMKGMKAPEWTIESDQAFSKSIGVQTRIFSVSTPGVSHIKDPQESATVARAMNQYCADLRDTDPKSYGFFATVPSLQHTDLAIEEIRHALDDLHADGITLFTSYATGTSTTPTTNQYLGHDHFLPVWEYLNARSATIFIHPCDASPNAPLAVPSLPAPTFDWPHETGKTAMSLILHHRLHQFPRVKIILSHAGGTLPLLVRRSTLIASPEFGALMTADEIMGQAKRFYFDTALSGSAEVLPLIVGFAERGHLLFGSDFPHATGGVARANAEFVDGFEGLGEERRKEVYYGAAEGLFPRLRGLFD